MDTEVYAAAGAVFLQVNDAVCDVISSAATAASQGGGMAGTDTGGVAWAKGYDGAAAAALTAGADLADRLGEIGVALAVSGGNHAGAEVASGAPTYSDASATPGAVSVLPAAPPSAAGGSTPAPSGWAVVAHLLPFRWPDADPDRLRTVATGWSTAAAGLQDAADRLTGPVGDLDALTSPEVDAAVTRCVAAQSAIRELAGAYASIGRACLALAGHIEQAHVDIRGALSGVGGLVSTSVDVGVAVVTGEDVADELRKLVDHLTEVLQTLRELVESAVDLIEDALTRITDLIDRLADLVTTAVTVGFTLTVAAPAAVAGIGRAAAPRVDLTAMEGPGEDEGHTIARHVGLTDQQLMDRADDEHLATTSTFTDLKTAESVSAMNIAANSARITKWLGKTKDHGELPVVSPAPSDCGRVYDAETKRFVVPRFVVTVLFKTGRGTFIILTSYLRA